MEDAVTVANTLHALLATHPNKKPSTVELQDAFRDNYQNARIDRVRAIVKVGGDLTRQQAYDGWKPYLVQRWMTPIVGLDTLAKNIAGLCVTAPKLTYIQFQQKKGILDWQDTVADAKEQEMHDGNVTGVRAEYNKGKRLLMLDGWCGGFEAIFPQILGVLVVIWSTVWLFHLRFSTHCIAGFGSELHGTFGAHNGTSCVVT
jgi:hypothetical protein